MTDRLRVSDVLHPDLVLLDIGRARKEDVLAMVAARLAAHLGDDGTRLAIALLKRERLMSTALADGIAIPHARVRDLPRTIAVLGRSAAGLDWDAQDGAPTHLFLVVLFPDHEPGSHLRVLASATRLLQDADCRTALMRAGDAEALLAALHAAEARAHDPAGTPVLRSVG